MDKLLNIILMTLIAVGGILILAVTWLEPMPLSVKIIPSVVGAAGIIGVVIWTLFSRSKSSKVRVTSAPDKADVKKKTF